MFLILGSANNGGMSLGHNLALGNLPFSALMSSSGGQSIPGLPFSLQPAALSLGLGGMIASQRAPSGVSRDCLPRQNPHETEAVVDGGNESECYLSQSSNTNREKSENKSRESRKRLRSPNLACESDDDIMVLSNSPSSNEHSEPRDKNQSNAWENSPIPIGLGFSIANPSMVNNSMYSADATSFMAAMGTQLPFDVM